MTVFNSPTTSIIRQIGVYPCKRWYFPSHMTASIKIPTYSVKYCSTSWRGYNQAIIIVLACLCDEADYLTTTNGSLTGEI